MNYARSQNQPSRNRQRLSRAGGRRAHARRRAHVGLGAQADPRRGGDDRRADRPDRAHPLPQRPHRRARQARGRPAGRRGADLRPRGAPARQGQDDGSRRAAGEAQGRLLGREDEADGDVQARRPRRLARGPCGSRPHAGAGRVPRSPRRHPVLRRRVLDARRRRDHGQAVPPLPVARVRHVARADRAGVRASRCARSTRHGSRPATAASSRRRARRWTARSPAAPDVAASRPGPHARRRHGRRHRRRRGPRGGDARTRRGRARRALAVALQPRRRPRRAAARARGASPRASWRRRCGERRPGARAPTRSAPSPRPSAPTRWRIPGATRRR